MTNQLYFEDLNVNDSFVSPTRQVKKEELLRFAAEFDPQPFHLDEEGASRYLFGELVASGWHTAAMTMALLVESLPLAGGVIGARVDELRWPRPVKPGDILRIVTEVLELRPSASRLDRGYGKFRTTTLNQDKEPVQVLITNIILQRRAA